MNIRLKHFLLDRKEYLENDQLEVIIEHAADDPDLAGELGDFLYECDALLDPKLWTSGLRFRNIKAVSIPQGVTTIPYKMFMDCELLESVQIPSSVTKIEGWSFFGCKKLSDLKIPSGVSYIGNVAFASCHSLKNVVLPKTLSYFADTAFANSKNVVINFEGTKSEWTRLFKDPNLMTGNTKCVCTDGTVYY